MNLDNGGELSVEDITEDRACICFVNPGDVIKVFILPKKYLDSLAELCYSHLQDGNQTTTKGD